MKKHIATLVCLILLQVPVLGQNNSSKNVSARQEENTKGKTQAEIDEVVPTAEQQGQFKLWLRQREQLQAQLNLLDAQINGGLTILMTQVLHLDTKDGWKPVEANNGEIKFIRSKAPEVKVSKEEKPDGAKP
jgi:hypothetical protein